MATFRLWPATNGPAATTSDTDNYTMGTEFHVTASGASAIAVYLWRPATSPATTFSVGIFQATSGTAGTLLGSVTGQSVAANYNGWYRVQLTTPIPLSTGVGYVAAVNSSTDNFYSATATYWAGMPGVTNGILYAPNSGGAYFAKGQSRFVASTTLTYPTNDFNATNYWIDVEVDDGTSTGVTGTLSAAIPKTTASLPGTIIPPTTGTLSAATPKATASLAGTVDNTTYATMSATLPKATASIAGASLTTGTLNAATPKTTASLPGSVYTTGSMSAAVPKVTASLSDSVLRTIAQENALTSGVLDRTNWFDYGADDIPGFARSTYYTPGQTAQFSVNYSSAYTCDVYRLGWYGGATNARKVATFAGTTASQPAAATIPSSNGAVTCAAWSANVSWSIPADATPGWYWMLMRNGGGTQFGGILFCVSDANNKQPILVVSSEATWGAAYNGYGGNNVYGNTLGVGTADTRALCSSYDKPVVSRDNVPQTHFFNGELAQLRFFERFGFDVGYTTIEQINNDPTIMDGRSLIVFSGHNEYISQRVRDKTEAVIASGVNVANYAANDFFWRTTYAGTTFPTGSTSTSTGRVMWVKKDSLAGPTAIRSGGAGTPFTSQADWTGTWQDTRYTNRKPSNALLGDRFIANGIRSDDVKVPFSMKGSPLWRNAAGVQALTTGQTYSFGSGTAGMEWDFPDGSLPSASLSDSSVTLTNSAADADGAVYDLTLTASHAVQMVRNGSAHILNFNTTQWGWALDDLHLRGSSIATATARQATLNGLYDLGATGQSALITAAGLTVPTAVSDIDVAYGLPATTTGALTATLPKVTSATTGAVITVGTMAAATPVVTSTLSGASLTVGSLSASTPLLVGSLTGQSYAPTTGTLDATVPKLAASLPGVIFGPVTGSLVGVAPLLTSTLTGSSLVTGSMSGTLPLLVANLPGAVFGPTTGQLAASTPVLVGSVGGVSVTVGVLSGTLPRVRGRIDTAVKAVVPRRLSATLRQPRYRGTMRA